MLSQTIVQCGDSRGTLSVHCAFAESWNGRKADSFVYKDKRDTPALGGVQNDIFLDFPVKIVD